MRLNCMYLDLLTVCLCKLWISGLRPLINGHAKHLAGQQPMGCEVYMHKCSFPTDIVISLTVVTVQLLAPRSQVKTAFACTLYAAIILQLYVESARCSFKHKWKELCKDSYNYTLYGSSKSNQHTIVLFPASMNEVALKHGNDLGTRSLVYETATSRKFKQPSSDTHCSVRQFSTPCAWHTRELPAHNQLYVLYGKSNYAVSNSIERSNDTQNNVMYMYTLSTALTG